MEPSELPLISVGDQPFLLTVRIIKKKPVITDLDTSWVSCFRHILLGWTPRGRTWTCLGDYVSWLAWMAVGGWWLFTYVFREMTNKMEVVCSRVTITSSTDFRKDCPIGTTGNCLRVSDFIQ